MGGPSAQPAYRIDLRMAGREHYRIKKTSCRTRARHAHRAEKLLTSRTSFVDRKRTHVEQYYPTMLIHTGVTKRENGTGRRTQQVVQWQFSQLCRILSKREGATRRRSYRLQNPALEQAAQPTVLVSVCSRSSSAEPQQTAVQPAEEQLRKMHIESDKGLTSEVEQRMAPCACRGTELRVRAAS